LLFPVLQGKDSAADTGVGKFSGSAAGSTASTSHTFEHIRFRFHQFCKLFIAGFVKVYPGTGV
jgi:hypothetical protein